MSKEEIEGHSVPLEERMLKEPFWLGLLTVFIVMMLIGIGYMLRKHLPEKMEKFLRTDLEGGGMAGCCNESAQGFSHLTPQMSVASDMNVLVDAVPDKESSPTSRTFLGRLTVRKPSILSISSAASSPGSMSPNPVRRPVSPMQDEEKRKILKMLISPNTERKRNLNEFMTDRHDQTMKAAKSAENLFTYNPVIRQESSMSLQVPIAGLGPRKVTFSQVVDQLVCSMSDNDSSSLSDISCGEDFKMNVSGSNLTRRNRKMYKPSRRQRARARNQPPTAYHGTSGSEEVWESSMESIESSNSFSLKPLSALAFNPGSQQKHKLNKISSADSLLSMIKNLASNRLSTSTPSSPQLSDNGEALSSGYPTPLSTPDTPNGSMLSINNSNRSSGKEKNGTKPGSQILVSVLNPLGPKVASLDLDCTNSPQSSDAAPSITLEVPAFNYGKCLSPIVELPTPLPTPCPSPLPTPMMGRFEKSVSQEDNSGMSDSSVSIGSSVSQSNSFKKLMNKAKTIPMMNNVTSPTRQSTSVSNDSCDSGEGNLDQPEVSVSDYSEISIPIPCFRSSSSSSNDASFTKSPVIPIIMTSIFDSSENLCKTVAEFKPGSEQVGEVTGRGRLVKQSQIPPNIVIPQVSISFEDETVEDGDKSGSGSRSPSSKSASPLTSPSGRIKKRPPPLIIPDSNFFNFGDCEIKSAPPLATQTSDTEMKTAKYKALQAEVKHHSLDSKPSIKVQEENIFELEETDNQKKSEDGKSLLQQRSMEDETGNKKGFLERRGKLLKQKFVISRAESFDSGSSGKKIGIFKQKGIDNSDLDSKSDCKVVDNQIDFLGGRWAVMKQSNVEEPESQDFLGTLKRFDSTPRSRSQSIEVPGFDLGGKLPEMSLPGTENKMSSEFAAGQTHVMVMRAEPNPPLVNIILPSPSVDEKQELCSTGEIPEPSGYTGAPLSINQQRLQNLKKTEKTWLGIRLGSPPLKREVPSFNFKSSEKETFPEDQHPDKKVLQKFEKPQSLDIDTMAPMIKITPMSDLESDTDSMGPCMNPSRDYLSPLSILMVGGPAQIPVSNCNSRATSESNLSSSGYSSMASPGPSRCGSFNPLCISESEDTSTPTSGINFFGGVGGPTPHSLGFVRRPSPLLKSPSCDSESSDQQNNPGPHLLSHRMFRVGTRVDRQALFHRYRTDSETTDDQIPQENVHCFLADSNDEGICPDVEEEKILKDCCSLNETSGRISPETIARDLSLHVDTESGGGISQSFDNPSYRKTFQLPEIVVQTCCTIQEQESTESAKSSHHNSIDEPQDWTGHQHTLSGSGSSRSESPVQSLGNLSGASLDTLVMRGLGPSNTDSEGIVSGDIQGTESSVGSSRSSTIAKNTRRRKERRLHMKKLSRSNSPIFKQFDLSNEPGGAGSCGGHSDNSGQASPKRSIPGAGRRKLKSQNKIEFPNSSSNESLASNSSSAKHTEPCLILSSNNSSSDESDQDQVGEEPVMSPPAFCKTSSSSTSTSKASSPLGSLTLLSLPHKAKKSGTQRNATHRTRRKKSPPLVRTSPVITRHLSDSCAPACDTSVDSYVRGGSEKWKLEPQGSV